MDGITLILAIVLYPPFYWLFIYRPKNKSKKMTDRNIHHNPTGKPFCCVIGCAEDATWQIDGESLDDMTQSCAKHKESLCAPGQIATILELPELAKPQ